MRSEEYRNSFSVIAPYYDALMSFVNYPLWVEYIEKICALHKVNSKIILDLACGTGVCLEMWHKKAYRIIGVDKSPAMLQVCRSKFHNADDPVLLINADMCSLKLGTTVPIVTCLYDSLNYLLSETDLLKCFRCVYEILEKDGIFIFDMNTLHCLRDEWGNTAFERHDNGIHSEWSNTFDNDNSISTLRITLTVQENGEALVLKEMHQERGYLLMTVAALLTEAGFDLSLYRHLTFNPAHERDMRVMGVARKC